MTYDVLIPWADWLPGHLAACVQSLAAQDEAPVWIYVGDIGRTPPFPSLAATFCTVVSQSRAGLFNRAAALNLAFRESPHEDPEDNHPYVLVVDADTVLLDSQVVADLLDRLGSHAAVWAICMDPNGTPHPNGSGGCLLVRREAWAKIGGYDEGYEGWGMEEHDFIERLRRTGYTIAEPLPAGRVLTLWHPRKTDPESVAAVLRNRERFRQKFGKE